MYLTLEQAIKALNGRTAEEVYNALDFDFLPYDSENDRYPTLDDIIAVLKAAEEKVS